MTTATKANTPRRSGRTADSFEQIRVHPIPAGGYASGVQSHYWKARLVEDGVKAHDLRPKRKRRRAQLQRRR